MEDLAANADPDAADRIVDPCSHPPAHLVRKPQAASFQEDLVDSSPLTLALERFA